MAHTAALSIPVRSASIPVRSARIPAPRSALPTIPLRDLAPFLIFGGLMLVLALFVVGVDQGATSMVGGSYLHEFVHDGRHLLGLPCH